VMGPSFFGILLLLSGASQAVETRAVGIQERLVPRSAEFPGTIDSAPALQWSSALPGTSMNSATHSEYTRPVVSGGHLYVGSAAGRALYRLSRRDGSLLKTYPASSSVESPPAVYKDRVYFADTGGYVWCYDLSGDLLWSRVGNAPILVQPTIVDGTVYVTNVDDLVVALNSKTGALMWRYQSKVDLTREAELTLYAAPPAVVIEDEVIVGFSDGSLVALNRKSGEVAWQRQIGEGRYPDLVAMPTTYGTDLVASGYFQPMVAIDIPTRSVRWRLDAGSAGAAVIHERKGKTVVYHPGSDGKLRAVSLLTGAESWVWDSGISGALTTPLMTPAGLFIGSSDRGLYLIHPETGDEVWRFHEDFILNGVSSAPVAAGRQLFFVSNAGNLYAMIAPRKPRQRRPAWP
jgi:outer membrane protein assembly factor BamB